MMVLMLIPLRLMAAALVGLVAIVYLNLFWISWRSSNDSVFSSSVHLVSSSSKEELLQIERWKQFGLADDDDDNNNGGEVEKEEAVVNDEEMKTTDREDVDTTKKKNKISSSSSSSSSDYKPILFEFARPMALMRQNISLSSVYKYPHRKFTGINSCTNPNSTMSTCVRTFRRSHKMGCVMTKDLLQQYLPHYQIAAEPEQFTYTKQLPKTDYRDALVLRNLYSAITSGYLYHYKGFECGMAEKRDSYLTHWNEYVSYTLNPQPRGNHTLCRYIQNTGRKLENRIVSVRAYVDWVMRYYYSGILSHWALSQQIPEIRERTLTVCYEDLMSEQHDQKTVQSIVDFFFYGSSYYKGRWDGAAPGHLQYDGEHSTETAIGVRNMVLKLIYEVDEKYYNGEIAWANSVLPCKMIPNELIDKRFENEMK